MQKRNKGKWIMERKIQTKLLSLVPLKRRQIHKGMSQKRKDKKLDCHYFLCLSLTSKWVFTQVHTAAWTDESKNLQKVAPTLQLSSSCEKMTGILLLLCCCCSNGTISTTSLPLLGTNRDKAAGCAAAPRHSLLVWTVVASDGEEQQQHQCSHCEKRRLHGLVVSCWNKELHRSETKHLTAIVIGVTTSSLSTLSLGVLEFQHTHLLVFGSTDSASSSSHIRHSFGSAGLDICR